MGQCTKLNRAVRECNYAMPEGYKLKQLDGRRLWWTWVRGDEVKGDQVGCDRLSPGPAVFDAWVHAKSAELAERDATIAKLQADAGTMMEGWTNTPAYLRGRGCDVVIDEASHTEGKR